MSDCCGSSARLMHDPGVAAASTADTCNVCLASTCSLPCDDKVAGRVLMNFVAAGAHE